MVHCFRCNRPGCPSPDDELDTKDHRLLEAIQLDLVAVRPVGIAAIAARMPASLRANTASATPSRFSRPNSVNISCSRRAPKAFPAT